MSEGNWYPKKLNVGPDGTRSTIDILKKIFRPKEYFRYAEFGIYKADTAKQVCENFSNSELHLFDFDSAIDEARSKLLMHQNRIFYYGNTQKYNDSYNWNLGKLILDYNAKPIFDYCFLDGAHTFAIDALNFFLCDKLTRVGGFIDFDDYHWTLRGSSLDPEKVPEISMQYTEEQISTKQVAFIVDALVKTDKRYKEILKNKVYQKVG